MSKVDKAALAFLISEVVVSSQFTGAYTTAQEDKFIYHVDWLVCKYKSCNSTLHFAESEPIPSVQAIPVKERSGSISTPKVPETTITKLKRKGERAALSYITGRSELREKHAVYSYESIARDGRMRLFVFLDELTKLMPSIEWIKRRDGKHLTWQKGMKEIMKGMDTVNATRLSGRGSREPQCVWLGTLEASVLNTNVMLPKMMMTITCPYEQTSSALLRNINLEGTSWNARNRQSLTIDGYKDSSQIKKNDQGWTFGRVEPFKIFKTRITVEEFPLTGIVFVQICSIVARLFTILCEECDVQAIRTRCFVGLKQ
ncbi:hypothetical protein CLF_105971 [Clonorchis sinensis]|uniref:Uncharacterized protein n=1 Tax=Clonorchis sinensis TaxID=79923 RepID=G7YEH2_CLOSI|nr:hypothetical protein CLF_105971 [Clonorchis sinensis]